jgi:hypothetical protein
MAIDKIELHEVEINVKQIKEASEAIKLLQDDLENTIDEYDDISERFSNGEISKKEFSDLTRSKNEHISSIKEKLNEHFKVFGKSNVILNSVLSRAKKELVDATSVKKKHKGKKKAKSKK